MEWILAIIKAIPTIGEWLDKLAVAYFQSRIADMSAENAQVIRKAFDEKDQREIENLINSPNAGKPTGLGNVVDDLPGVQKPDTKRN